MNKTIRSNVNQILILVELHHLKHPDHGIDCICMDKFIQDVRELTDAKSSKEVQQRVDYVIRSALNR